ncbi:MAG: AAA family ATPase [Blastocatellia bacterium]
MKKPRFDNDDFKLNVDPPPSDARETHGNQDEFEPLSLDEDEFGASVNGAATGLAPDHGPDELASLLLGDDDPRRAPDPPTVPGGESARGRIEFENPLFDEDDFRRGGEDGDFDYERWRTEQIAKRREFIEKLPLDSPQQIAARVADLGYKGQEPQRRGMALLAYRHIRRLKRLHVEGIERRLMPPKQNTLLAGPTGCGKTFLVEILFQQLLQLPTVIVDITSFTESGYVGDDVRTILTRLVSAADGNLMLAECGVICLDEFDKIAASTSNARFAGEGTTKDVSGYGVQRELLTMLHGSDVMAPMDFGQSQFGPRAAVSTHDIPFIACGAFAGMETLLQQDHKSIGFRGAGRDEDKPESGGGSVVLEEVETFQRYGFLPELMGRFTRIVSFPPLSAETLRQILRDNVLPQYKEEFAGEKLDLQIAETALDHIVTRSVKRKTGARGLHSELAAAIEQAAYETFGVLSNASVLIDLVNGRLEGKIAK